MEEIRTQFGRLVKPTERMALYLEKRAKTVADPKRHDRFKTPETELKEQIENEIKLTELKIRRVEDDLKLRSLIERGKQLQELRDSDEAASPMFGQSYINSVERKRIPARAHIPCEASIYSDNVNGRTSGPRNAAAAFVDFNNQSVPSESAARTTPPNENIDRHHSGLVGGQGALAAAAHANAGMSSSNYIDLLYQSQGISRGYVNQPTNKTLAGNTSYGTDIPLAQSTQQKGLHSGPLLSSTAIPQIEFAAEPAPSANELLSTLVTAITERNEMPRPEIITFDGNPIDYFRFTHSFDTNISARTKDNRQKLSYLIQYCSGDAKEAIVDCVFMEPEAGYMTARDILKRQFGSPHIISRSYIKSLKEGPQVKPNDSIGLSRLSMQMERCEITLDHMGYSSDINSTDTILTISRRLPFYLRMKWAEKADTIIEQNREPAFKDLVNFVKRSARVASTLYGQDIADQQQRENKPATSAPKPRVTTMATNQGESCHNDDATSRCGYCNNIHELHNCQQFRQLKPEERKTFTRSKGLCDNCFYWGHRSRNCRQPRKCTIDCTISWKHHELLHPTNPPTTLSAVSAANPPAPSVAVSAANPPAPSSVAAATIPPTASSAVSVATLIKNTRICLKVVPVTVVGNGANVETYALLDDCSDSSLCSESLLNKLNIKGKPKKFTLSTIATDSKETIGHETNLVVRSKTSTTEINVENVWTVKEIPITAEHIPKQADLHLYQHLHDIVIPEVAAGKVELLIGSNTPEAFWISDERRGQKGEPYALKTLLGWAIIGPLSVGHRSRALVNFTQRRGANEKLYQQVERFWTLEFNERFSTKEGLSVNDKRALRIMEESTTMKDGHYVVGLPWKHDVNELQNNRLHAETRLNDLRKYKSNSKNVMSQIPEAVRGSCDNEHPTTEKTLGIRWSIAEDSLSIGHQKKDQPCTRRGILSTLSAVFDPLGLVGPVLLPAKILLQRICRDGNSWDSVLDDDVASEWNRWLENLQYLPDIKVGRQLGPSIGVISRELHTFADASQDAYGAVCYMRTITDTDVQCSFVMGKSHLAPKKVISIPRIELMAAVVAVRICRLVREELDFQFKDDAIYFWSDSTCVLQYIRNEERRFKVFVANRLAEIHEQSSTWQWRHVCTEENVADIASRGILANDYVSMQRWLSGPDFLQASEQHWPAQPKCLPLSDQDVELKTCATTCVMSRQPIDDMIERCSSINQLTTSVVWILRFVDFLRNKSARNCAISIIETKTARLKLIAFVQHQVYEDEVKALSQDKPVKVTSPLRKLSPFLDENLIRVGGRICRAPLAYDMIHPIILPQYHHLSKLIIEAIHKQEGHCGPSHVLAVLRREYWIPQGRAAVKRVLERCISCKRRQATVGEQIMAPLPEVRVTPHVPPFSYIGIDYYGPMYVKQGRSHVKRYGCLITCLSSRAIHLEIAHTLDTNSFLAALHRFISRRGRPLIIFSDNGTNFVSGERELKELLQGWNQKVIGTDLRQREIEWHFNPPGASHMGGVWERMVRSVKEIMKALLCEQLVCDEALLTFTAEVERILNDRPITAVSDDPKDLEALTPNKLLLLRSNSCIPPGACDVPENNSRRWFRHAQYLASIFWRRWIQEYLPQLQKRQKWTQKRRNFKENDLVLVVDENVPRGQWQLGKVVEVISDDKGHVRSVRVRTSTSTKLRPITKICLLEEDVECEVKRSLVVDKENVVQLDNGNIRQPRRAGLPQRFRDFQL